MARQHHRCGSSGAGRYRIPCLMIVCNNRSFFSDELHQERVAITRGRPPENRWIGQRIADPDIDLAAMARAQGATGIGPITRPAEIRAAIEQGIEVVRAGGVCVIDARVQPGGPGRSPAPAAETIA